MEKTTVMGTSHTNTQCRVPLFSEWEGSMLRNLNPKPTKMLNTSFSNKTLDPLYFGSVDLKLILFDLGAL